MTLEERIEYDTRILKLMMWPRLLTEHAATIIVEGAMFGIGCTEGTVRAQIEAQKAKVTDV